MLRILFILALSCAAAQGFELPAKSTQAVVGVTTGWQSSHVTIYLYEKQKGGWKTVAGPWQGRVGKSGLAWGRGLHPHPKGTPLKKEGDWKAPAGVFHIGGAWGYPRSIKKHSLLPYRQVTSRDLWVEDPKSPNYNRHLVLDHEPKAAWEKKAQMRQGDYPHSLKLFIGHNRPPKPVPGAGSAIFFHIWRGGGAKPTSGCTTLHENSLRSLIARIDPRKQPLYILLPKKEYDRQRGPWKLP